VRFLRFKRAQISWNAFCCESLICRLSRNVYHIEDNHKERVSRLLGQSLNYFLLLNIEFINHLDISIEVMNLSKVPVCVTWCLFRSYRERNLLSHPIQVHFNGLEWGLWTYWCRVNLYLVRKESSHSLQTNLCVRLLSNRLVWLTEGIDSSQFNSCGTITSSLELRQSISLLYVFGFEFANEIALNWSVAWIKKLLNLVNISLNNKLIKWLIQLWIALIQNKLISNNEKLFLFLLILKYNSNDFCGEASKQ